jgi:hypothetical protein
MAGTLGEIGMIHTEWADASAADVHFDTITVSVPDAPRPDEIVVILAIGGGRLANRCGTAPIRS